MKKLFLVLLAGGIMMTACKKEEKEMPTSNPSKSWKTSDWVMTKEDVNIDGNICDEYQNVITGQKIYEAKIVLKSVDFDGIFYPGCDPLDRDECKDDGKECKNAIFDGESVIILKRPNMN